MPARASRSVIEGMVLAVLDAGPCHAYAIFQELETRGFGHIELTRGSIHRALARMERAGVVRGIGPADDAWQRRIYELTPAGRPLLDAERGRWREFAAAVTAVLGAPAGEDM